MFKVNRVLGQQLGHIYNAQRDLLIKNIAEIVSMRIGITALRNSVFRDNRMIANAIDLVL